MKEYIAVVADQIHTSQQVSVSGVKGALQLPPQGREAAQVLVPAIDYVLKKHFGIRLGPDHKTIIARHEPLHFLAQSPEGLPERSVSFDFETSPPQLKIAGRPAKDGQDGYTDIAFDWRKRPGTTNEDGTFDWKKINSVPSIRKNEVIATVYDRTEGEPGIDCFGRIIRQRPGRRHQIRWVKNHIYRDSDGENIQHFNLLARTSGVVNYSFMRDNDPRTLEWVSISDTLKIDGDIDYSLGDLDSAASLDISGSVLGNFSLKSDGHIHVGGSIEGHGVDAKSVHAELITNRCIVTAQHDIETQNITNAEANAEYIRIGMNASRATLNAREKIIIDNSASVTGLSMRAKTLRMNSPVISGKNHIVLGAHLFLEAKRLRPLLNQEERKISNCRALAKEMASAILTALLRLEKYFTRTKSTLLYNLINRLKSGLVVSFKSFEAIAEPQLAICTELLAVLAERNFENSILRKVDAFCRSLSRYNEIQAQFAAADSAFQLYRKEFDDTVWQIKNELVVLLAGAKIAGGNVELKISCGDAELVLHESDLQGTAKEIRYEVPDDSLPLTKGSLNVS